MAVGPSTSLSSDSEIAHNEIALVSQGKRNHNICGVRQDYGVEVFEEYRLV
jgi:hypothetical protein